MTDQTGAAKQPAKPGLSTAEGFIVALGLIAVFAWMAGVALDKGFGVHAPFIASWLLLAVGVSVVKTTAHQVAQVWHAARVEADVAFMAVTMAAHQSSLADLLKSE